MTFSVIGRAPDGALGIAVASKFLAAGAVVPHVQAEVGAVATQSYANPLFGPLGLAAFAQGKTPQQIAQLFEERDPQLQKRQFGLLSASGQSLSFTGRECHAWAGGMSEQDVAIQGNILTGPEVVQAMHQTWQAHAELELPQRLLKTLQAGDKAGGDKRGRQSAALLCAGKGRGYDGLDDNWINLRVDDHSDPCSELERLLDIQYLLLGSTKESRALSEAELDWLRATLIREGYAEHLPQHSPWDAATQQAALALYANENLTQRWQEGGQFDTEAWHYLRQKFDHL